MAQPQQTAAVGESEEADRSSVSEEERKANAEAAAKLTEFSRRYAPAAGETKSDSLQDRYRIELSSPLPEFDGKTAQAFAATDSMEPTRPMFAHVCRPGTVQRYRVIAALKAVTHPSLTSVIAAGVVTLSRPAEERFVIFYERPAGRRLSDLLAQSRGDIGEQFVYERIIAPLASAINQLADLDISHGLVNPDNIYFKDSAVLGPCASEPCGYSQPFYFEPLERMQAQPAGKGEGSAAHDYYALAVVVLSILHGPKHLASFTPDSLARAVLREGVYNALTRQRDVPEIFYDFFRGMLTQTGEERWTYRQLKPWLDGKRYNVLPPPLPVEAIRPFEFGEGQANTRRELAHLFSMDWERIASVIQSNQLTHWVAVSLRNKDLAENVTRINRTLTELGTKNEIQRDEQLMRIIMLLDPGGPIRLKHLSMHIDGIDTLSAELYATKAHQELQMLAKFIEFNMGNYWLERQRKNDPEFTLPNPINAMFIKLDKLRACIRNTGYGFGLERMIYDLNPDLPCLSPLLAGHHVTSLAVLLKKLDKLASTLSQDDPIDRHISAFIASKLGIQHEIRLHELAASPALANNRTLLTLHLLSIAQQRAANMHLHGLTHWLALRVMPLLDGIHSRSLRQKVKAMLVERAESGAIPQIAELVITSDYASADQNGYTQARNLYYFNAAKIERYRHDDHINEESARVGFMMAKAVAYTALACSIISIFRGM